MTHEKYVKGLELKTGITYSASNGIFRLIDNKMYKAIAKIDDADKEEELEEELTEIKLPKIPIALMNKIRVFFKQVYKEHKSEVAILLWYNFETGDWRIEVPKQTVSGASVRYTRLEEDNEQNSKDGFICVGSIHSHASMGAFHSGVDDEDEYNFDGIHITIGKLNSELEYACRFIIKKTAYKLDYENCVEIEDCEVGDLTDWMDKVNKTEYKAAFTQYVYPTKFKDVFKCPVCRQKNTGNKQVCAECGFDFQTNPDDYFEQLACDSDNAKSNKKKNKYHDYGWY